MKKFKHKSIIKSIDDVIYPQDLAAYWDAGNGNEDINPTKPAQFIGFQCLTCGERHAELRDLVNCAEVTRLRMATADVLAGIGDG